MKNFFIVVLISSFAFVNFTCKRTTETIIDCAVESLFAVIHADLDSVNPNLMHFKFEIPLSDGVTLDNSIKWDFGNGHSVTADTMVSYEYPEKGSYEAYANYTLRKDGASCSTSSKKHIVIN